MANFWKIVNRVIAESDIILEVIDARLIKLTRNIEIEQKIIKAGKSVIFVINKCDLVDKDYVEKQKKHLKHSVFISAKDKLGTTMLKKRIFQVAKKYQVTVGVVGYPNTGKSSVINSLAGKAKAQVSSFSGFTRGVQIIKAGKRIRLLDTPGVIPFINKNQAQLALLGALDVSKVKEPDLVAMELIESLDTRVQVHYGIEKSKSVDSEELLEEIAVKCKRLVSGGKPDLKSMGKIIIKDWQKGKIR